MGRHNLIPSILLKCHVQHARHSLLPTFSPFFLLFSSSSPFSTHTHRNGKEREIADHERERELCCQEEEEEAKTRVLESSVQSASTAPIDDHPWSDEAEILQGGSQHVNLHCERWRSDLEQSAVVFLHVNSSSVLE
jgi:hypothetical protein